MDLSENTKALGTEKLTKLILKFSIPCILSLLISSLYNIVDQIFIGNSKLSALGNAATSVVFPVFIIAQAFAWCFGDGCASYLNICQGENNSEDAHKAIGGSITIAFLAGLVMLAVIYPFKKPFSPCSVRPKIPWGTPSNISTSSLRCSPSIFCAIPLTHSSARTAVLYGR